MNEICLLQPPAPHAAISTIISSNSSNTHIPTTRLKDDDDDNSCVDLWADVASSQTNKNDQQRMNYSRFSSDSSRPNRDPQHLDIRSTHKLSTRGNKIGTTPRRFSSNSSSKRYYVADSPPQRISSKQTTKRPSLQENRQRQNSRLAGSRRGRSLHQHRSTSALTNMRSDQHPGAVSISFHGGGQSSSRFYSTGISQFEMGDYDSSNDDEGPQWHDTRRDMVRSNVPDDYEQQNASGSYQSHDKQRALHMMQSGRSRQTSEQESSPERSNTFRRETSPTLKKQVHSMVDLCSDPQTSIPRYSSNSPRRRWTCNAFVHSQGSRSIGSSDMPMHSQSNHSHESRTRGIGMSSISRNSYTRPGMLLNISNHELESKSPLSTFNDLQDGSRTSFIPNSFNCSHQSVWSDTSNHVLESRERRSPARPISSKDHIRSQLSRSLSSSIGSGRSSEKQGLKMRTRQSTMISNHSLNLSRASISDHSRESATKKRSARPSNRSTVVGGNIVPHYDSRGELSGTSPPGTMEENNEKNHSPPGRGSDRQLDVRSESRSRGLFDRRSSKKKEEEEEQKKSQFLFCRFKKC